MTAASTVLAKIEKELRAIGEARGPATRILSMNLVVVAESIDLATRYTQVVDEVSASLLARAIVVEPSLLILDEPTSALDVSVQAVILRLLDDLRTRLGMSYLFVSHDLNVVRLLCERIVVMYLGKVVEVAPAETLFTAPAHPYTQALIAAIPDPARRGEQRIRLDGSPRSPIEPNPQTCRFYGRCSKGTERCTSAMPALRRVGEGHLAACHFA